MIQIRRHLVSSLVALSVVVSFASLAHAPATPSKLEPIAPPHFIEIQQFLETRLVRLPDPDIKRLTRTILDESKRHRIHPVLIAGLIHVESSGNPRAVSNVGALGLMQLRPATARAMARERGLPWNGPESLFEPNFNVRLGVYYLAKLVERFGDVDTALAAYNFGPTRIARAIRSGRHVPARYARRVQRVYSTLI